jgi:hypothetical protein
MSASSPHPRPLSQRERGAKFLPLREKVKPVLSLAEGMRVKALAKLPVQAVKEHKVC